MQRYDLWAILLANKVMVQYHEATGDERVPPVMERFLRRLDKQLDAVPLFVWGR